MSGPRKPCPCRRCQAFSPPRQQTSQTIARHMQDQELEDALGAPTQQIAVKRQAEELEISDVENSDDDKPGPSSKRAKFYDIEDDALTGPFDDSDRLSPEIELPGSRQSDYERTPSSPRSWTHTPSETASGLRTPEIDPDELEALLNEQARMTPRRSSSARSDHSSQARSRSVSSGNITPPSHGSSLHSSRAGSPHARTPPRSPSPDEDDTDITQDPDFFNNEELPDEDPGDGDADTGPPDEEARSRVPRALSEHSWIRKCYISAFIQHMYHGANDEAISAQLKLDRLHLLDVRDQTGIDIPGLEKMAVTRLAAERRLGLDPDEHILFQLACTRCWELHLLRGIGELESSGCLKPDCEGELYKVKALSDGRTKRVPCMIVSRSPLIPAIERMMQRPGKPKQYNSWRQGNEDQPGPVAPLAVPPGDGDDAYPDGSHRIYDMTGAWGFRAIPAFLERQRGREHGHWEFADVNVQDRNQRFVALPNGLVFVINMDWFQPMKRSAFGSHSTGVVFATVVNNPNPIRFHPREMFFLIAIPGPSEPDAVATGKLLDMVVDEFEKLYGGVQMRIDGFAAKQPVHGHCYLDLSDLPASRKLSGLRGHTAGWWMCPWCEVTFNSLTHTRCFDPDWIKSHLRQSERYVKYAFRWLDADTKGRDEISERRGVQYSPLNRLPEWYPDRDSPLDGMHAAFLDFLPHVVKKILIRAGIFTSQDGSASSPLDRFNRALESIVWPSNVSRPPKKLSNVYKADQWARLNTVLPALLYCAFQENGEIPDRDAPRPKLGTNAHDALLAEEALVNKRRLADLKQRNIVTTKEQEERERRHPVKIGRNILRHFNNVLEACVAIRIWTARSTTPDETLRAQNCYARALQDWARMNCHLTPYCHLLLHLRPQILRTGPLPSSWLYGYERANGWLAKVNTNGHAGGQLEATLMRTWIRSQLAHDLITHLENMPEKSDLDLEVLKTLKSYASGARTAAQRTAQAAFLDLTSKAGADNNTLNIYYSSRSGKINLEQRGLYHLVLAHVRNIWAQTVNLVAPGTAGDWAAGDEIFSPTLSAREFTNVYVAARAYGAYEKYQGSGLSNAYIDGRQPVRILRLLRVVHKRQGGVEGELSADLAVVKRLVGHETLPRMPWELREIDVGYSVWLPDTFGEPEVVDVRRFTGQYARMTIPIFGCTVSDEGWLCISQNNYSEEQDIP